MRYILIIILFITPSLSFAQTGEFEKVSVTNELGVGTDSPEEKVHIKHTGDYGLLLQRAEYGDGQKNLIRFASSGSVGVVSAYLGSVRAPGGNGHLVFGTNSGSSPITIAPVERMRLTSSGDLGLGTSNPVDKLTVVASMPEISLRGKVPNQFEGGRIRFGEYSNTNDQGAFIHYDASVNIFNIGVHHANTGDDINSDYNAISIIRSSGNVGIGTQAPGSHKLAVNGTILAKEIKVEANWADFVFEDDYQLMKLSDLEKFIEENGHLPEIPTEKEVEENGISLGDMNSKLLQKIEELTLYTIQLQKENKNLQQQQEDQAKRIEIQQKTIKSLQNLEERLSRLENLK